MNTINNPYYNCVTSKTNPYLDTVTFKPVTSALDKQTQIVYLFEKLSIVTNSVPYIVSADGSHPCPFYTHIMNEVHTSPAKYNCTRQELQSAYKTTFEAINNINISYQKTKTINQAVFKYGVTVLNNIFYEDACNGKINFIFFVDGMKRMAADLYKFKSANMS